MNVFWSTQTADDAWRTMAHDTIVGAPQLFFRIPALHRLRIGYDVQADCAARLRDTDALTSRLTYAEATCSMGGDSGFLEGTLWDTFWSQWKLVWRRNWKNN